MYQIFQNACQNRTNSEDLDGTTKRPSETTTPLSSILATITIVCNADAWHVPSTGRASRSAEQRFGIRALGTSRSAFEEQGRTGQNLEDDSVQAR